MKLQKASALALTALTVAALTACGGGGGGGGSFSSAGGTTVSGTASKGLLKGAKVTAYCGLKASNVVVGTATTDSTGNYSLTLTSACSQPLEIEVTAVSGTKMLDEVKGEIDAPTGFSMRALVNAGSGTITQPVTPFTDMAAAVAKNAVSNGQTLSSSLVNNANTAIITNVLGGNAGIFTATPVPPSQYTSVSADQQKLITLLSAISASAAASSGSGTDAEKIQATLSNLATQAVATVPAVTATGYSVNNTATTPLTTLSSGLTALSTTTLADSTTSATIKASATTVQTTVVNTASTTIANSTATVTTPDSTVQTAIAKAQLLFQTIRANLLSIANDANTGLLQSKAAAMTTDFTNASPVSNFAVGQMVSAMDRAVEYLIEVKNAGGNPSVLGETLNADTIFGNYFERTWGYGAANSLSSAMKCRVYTTTGTGVVGATPARQAMLTAQNVTDGVYGAVCSFFPYANDTGTTVRQVMFAVKTPSATLTSPTTFTYVNKIRTYSAGVCDFHLTSCAAADSTSSDVLTYTTGSITASWDSNGAIGATLPTDSKLVSMDGTSATTANLSMTSSFGSTSGSVSVSGSIAAGNLLSMSILPGSTVSATLANGSPDSVNASFLAQLDTANFRYNGTFTANGSGLNSVSGATGTVGFTGKISTLASGGVASPFLEGSISANSGTKVAAFSAKVTDGSKVNSVSGTLNGSIANKTIADITYNFPGYSMSFAGNRDNVSPANSTMTVTASDGTKIVATYTETLVKESGGTTIGTVVSGGRVNFTDGTYFVMN